ncbi:MAG: membrane protein insertase YidC [Candidatus Solibacter usitatus]|nr:membrane protein insertase YidC [Candidatus Solibacter usitatus]
MSDEIKPDTPDTPKKGKELSMEMRLLIAFILMGAVLFVTPYFYKSVNPPAPVTTKNSPAAAVNAPAETPPAPEASKAAGKAESTKAAPSDLPRVAAEKEETFVVDTDLYHVVFSNRGAVVQSWLLKKFATSAGKPLELINTAAAAKAGYPFQLVFKERKPAVDLNQALYSAKQGADSLTVSYEFADGKTQARKSFHFQKDSYLVRISSEVLDTTIPVPHLLAWRGGFGDSALPNASGLQHSIHYDVTASKLITNDAKAAKSGPVSSSGTYSFAGIEDTYFAAAFLPDGNGAVEIMTFGDNVPTLINPKEELHVGAAVGGAGRNEYSVFVGPKDVDILRKVNPQLEQIVDWGWFALLAKPIFLAVHYVSERWVHNYGWSIIIVTIGINFVLLPLRMANMKSMKKMQLAQPEVLKIKEKYKNVGLRDPRKQQENEEVMALYKKHGANPMGGCVPMLLQIPFFIAFYKVLSVTIEMRNAHWLWVSDLSSPEQLAIRILPIAMIATQFIMQKMTPAAGVDPAQQRMMMLMPLMMGFFFYNLSSGLVLYYVTTNLLGIAQQWFFNQTMTPADVGPAAIKKRNGR